MSTVSIPLWAIRHERYRNRMDMNAVLERISAKRAELGLSDAELSQVAGSRDLIRNWRRAARDGHTIQARHGSLEAIATRLGVSLAWLTTGEAGPNGDLVGFSEAITSFVMAPTAPRGDEPQSIAAIRAVMPSSTSTPATFKAHEDMPWFAICGGDILVADLARLPKSGDLALATIQRGGGETTTVVRIAEPWAIEGPLHAPTLHSLATAAIIVRHPIVGIIRHVS